MPWTNFPWSTVRYFFSAIKNENLLYQTSFTVNLLEKCVLAHIQPRGTHFKASSLPKTSLITVAKSPFCAQKKIWIYSSMLSNSKRIFCKNFAIQKWRLEFSLGSLKPGFLQTPLLLADFWQPFDSFLTAFWQALFSRLIFKSDLFLICIDLDY